MYGRFDPDARMPRVYINSLTYRVYFGLKFGGQESDDAEENGVLPKEESLGMGKVALVMGT